MEASESPVEPRERPVAATTDRRLDANAQRIRASGVVLLLAVLLTGAWALPQRWDAYALTGSRSSRCCS